VGVLLIFGGFGPARRGKCLANNDKHNRLKTGQSGDKPAKWTKKGKQLYYAYKAHMAVGAEHGFILIGHATAANWPYCKKMIKVLKNADLEKEHRPLPAKVVTQASTTRPF
jgi:IS5 family transposase